MMRLTSFIALVAPAVGFHLAVRPLTTRLSIRMEEEDDGRRGFGVAFSGDDEAIKRDAKLVFAVLDKSGDGEVDRKELSEHLTKAGHAQDQMDAWFGALDADGSGSISQDEFAQAYLEYPGMREYPGLGASDDGDIPQAIRMDATNFIAAVDSSRDGAVSSAELEAQVAVDQCNN